MSPIDDQEPSSEDNPVPMPVVRFTRQPLPDSAAPYPYGHEVPFGSRAGSNPAAEPPQRQGGDLEKILVYLRIVRDRKWQVLALCSLGLISAIIIARLQTPLYHAQAALEIQGVRESFGASGAASTLEQSQNQAARLLQSRTLIDRVSAKLLGRAKGSQKGPSKSPAGKNLSAEGTMAPADMVEAVTTAALSLRVVSAFDHTVLTISCDSSKPEIAAEFLNSLMDEYILRNQEDRWDIYHHTGQWLVQAQQALKAKLRDSEQSLREYVDKTNLLLSSDHIDEKTPTVSTQRLKDLQAELSRAQADRIIKESQWRTALTTPPEALPQTAENGASKYETELAGLRKQLAELKSSLTPAHYKVKRVQAQISEMESTLAKERKTVIQRLQNQYEAARHTEDALRSEFVTQTSRVAEESGKLGQYNILKQEVEINRQLYDTVLRKVEEASIESALRTSDSRVIDRAVTPAEPYKPNVPLYSGIGLISGLGLGVLIAVVRDRLDVTIRAPRDLCAALNLRELGAIPSVKHDVEMRRLRGGSTSQARNGNRIEERLAEGRQILRFRSRLPIEFATWMRASSLTAESFRSVLTSLVRSGNSWSRQQTLIVTSPGQGEGKTSVTTNLAIAIADIGWKVLLIDADLRRPRLHKIFGVDNQKGLSLLFYGGDPAPIDDLVYKTDVPSLFLLPAGPAVINRPTSLLHSAAFQELLMRCRTEFDVILIDTPPMLPYSDARIVATLVDGVILVLRNGKTSRDAAASATQRLREDGTPVVGAILNECDSKAAGYGYGYGYQSVSH